MLVRVAYGDAATFIYDHDNLMACKHFPFVKGIRQTISPTNGR